MLCTLTCQSGSLQDELDQNIGYDARQACATRLCIKFGKICRARISEQLSPKGVSNPVGVEVTRTISHLATVQLGRPSLVDGVTRNPR
jgi:hypothetical protein